MRQLLLALFLIALSACTGVPEGVQTVDSVDPERYLGTWYAIARLDHSFERGLSNVTASYSAREDGGINVLNRGYHDEDGKWKQAEGKAYPINEGDFSRLKVSFFGPFYGGYNIIALDSDYQWAMVAGPTRGYLWILSREPSLAEPIVNDLVAKAQAWDFDVNELIFVEQGTAPTEG